MNELIQKPLESLSIFSEKTESSLKGLVIIEQIANNKVYSIIIAKDKVKELIHRLKKEIS